jgi:hypothetical protein
MVFALDCTVSMRPFIDAAKTTIKLMVDDLARLYPDVPLRMAIIGYRDHAYGDKRLEILRFTTKIAEVKAFVAILETIRHLDNDSVEDVFGALKVAETMDWQSSTRILYHVADAPCHGREFHDMDDNYPHGDPHGLKAVDLLTSLKAQRVVLFRQDY